jgi:hypothetical protein
MDAHKNFAYSQVATAPITALAGTSLVVATGDGAKFPAVPFNATVWQLNTLPTVTTAEIVRVTGIAGDTLTIVRAQESSNARTIVVGDQIAATITAKTLTDIETSTLPISQITTLTGTQNDLVLTTGSMFLTLYCNNAADIIINGFVAGSANQRLRVASIGAGNVFLAPQAAGSAAANRLLNMCTSGVTPLAAGVGVAEYQYDATASRWRLMVHEQGAPVVYTVVWTGQTTNPAIGNGTLVGSFLLHGRLIDVAINLSIGSTTTLGTGSWLFSLPFPIVGTPTCGSGFVTSSGGSVQADLVSTVTTFIHAAGDIIGILATSGVNVASGSPAGITTNDAFRVTVLNVPVG